MQGAIGTLLLATVFILDSDSRTKHDIRVSRHTGWGMQRFPELRRSLQQRSPTNPERDCFAAGAVARLHDLSTASESKFCRWGNGKVPSINHAASSRPSHGLSADQLGIFDPKRT